MEKKLRESLLFMLVPTLLVLLVGCGKKVGNLPLEKAVEKAIEKESGDQAKVDVEQGQIKIETEQGKFEAGENVKLPADFPNDVYVLEGKVVSAISDQANNGASVSVESDKNLAEILSLYQEKFAGDGWKITGTMNFNESVLVSAEKDNRVASIMASKSDNKSMVVITVANN